MGFAERMQQVQEQAGQKEATRQRERAEAAQKRKDAWNNLVGGAKDRFNQFRDWDRQAGADLRHAVDIAPGVATAIVATGAEKAVAGYNAAVDAGKAFGADVAETGRAVKTAVVEGGKAVGRAVVEGAVIGVGLGVMGVEAAVGFIGDRIEEGKQTAEDIGEWVGDRVEDARVGAENLRKTAVEGFHNRVEATKKSFNEKREAASSWFKRTSERISGGIESRINKGKAKIEEFHQNRVDDFHGAMAGALGIEQRMAGGVRGFLEGMAGAAARAETFGQENREKHQKAKSTYVEVAAVLGQE